MFWQDVTACDGVAQDKTSESSDEPSRGSSALIDELDRTASLTGPNTPDALPGALVSDCNNSYNTHSFTGLRLVSL